MKALKVVLAAVLVSVTMMGMAQSVDKVKPTFNSKMIPLTSIDNQTDLIVAILNQVDAKFFLFSNEHSGMYIATVRLNHKVYKIFGTNKQWYRFFKIQPRLLPYEKANKDDRKIR